MNIIKKIIFYIIIITLYSLVYIFYKNNNPIAGIIVTVILIANELPRLNAIFSPEDEVLNNKSLLGILLYMEFNEVKGESYAIERHLYLTLVCGLFLILSGFIIMIVTGEDILNLFGYSSDLQTINMI